MEFNVSLLLGITLILSAACQINCASLTHHFRSVREVEFPDNLNSNTTNNDITTSTDSPISSSSLRSITDTIIDVAKNNSLNDKEINRSEIKNDESNEKKEDVTNLETILSESKEKTEDKNVVLESEEQKATGRSLNINVDIDKYVSPDFHNKNNVYSLPTSPEIEKFLGPNSQEFTDEAVESTSMKLDTKTSSDRSELTTPESQIFDTKYRMLVDGIKQNLDENIPNGDRFENDEEKTDKQKYDISQLMKNYENANNDTEVSLETKEFKNVGLITNPNKGNRDIESGRNVNYESNYFRSTTYDDNPEISDNNNNTSNSILHKSIDSENDNDNDNEETRTTRNIHAQVTTYRPTTPFIPSKRPDFQISLRNNTIETTATNDKPKIIKYYPTDDSSSLNPVYETYTKPTYENTINLTKRGSTKLVGIGVTSTSTTTATPNFMNYDNKNFSIPPTATAWTLVTNKDVSITTTESNIEQNSQENNISKSQFSSFTKDDEHTTEVSTTEKSSSVNDKSTTIWYNEMSTNTNTEQATTDFEKVTENLSQTTFNDKDEDENFSTTITDNISTTNSIKESSYDTTTLNSISNTVVNFSSSSYMTSTEKTTDESTTDYTSYEPSTNRENETTESTDYTITTLGMINEDLYTTSKNEQNMTEKEDQPTTLDIESTTPYKISSNSNTSTGKTISNSEISSNDEDIDNNFGENENDYDIIYKKEKNGTDDTEIEITDEHESRSTENSRRFNESTSLKPVLNDELFNSTIGATTSTELLSHDDYGDNNNSGMIAAIAISSVGGICLIILAGLLLIMRKRQKRVTYGQRCRPVSLDAYSLDNVSVYNSVRRKGALRASKRSYGNPAFDDPESISHQMNFQTLVKFVDNSDEINNEFDEIPQVTVRANEIPVGCETKNRYANIIPLPETRVFLKPFDNDPNSDYINANYVTGPKNTRGYYIACQGPLQSTVDDFWRMVWEQQCKVILMLTNLYENGIEKCADYLPPSEVVDCHRLFGDFQITLKKREVKEKYIISSLQLKNMVSNSWREVTHLWYLGWPERGVPTEANSLIAFLIEARSHLKTVSNNNSSDDKTNESTNVYISGASGAGSSAEGGPMVVHCSPGTGRTGTVIACDIAIRDFELTRNVDIPKIVYRIRRDRANAVQTRDQYAFIYKVISLYATKLTGGALDSIN